MAVIRAIEKRGALTVASRIYHQCVAFFDYAVVLGITCYKPASVLHVGLEQHSSKNYRHLSAADLRGFLCAIDGYNGRNISRLAMKLMKLTFFRTYELRHAEWVHIDLVYPEWRTPPRYMKMKRQHIVPLTKQAVAVIKQIQQLTGNRSFLFPNEARPLEPMLGGVLLKLLEGVAYKEKTTVHGLRATASTIFNENGFNADMIERQLALVELSRVRAAYNRGVFAGTAGNDAMVGGLSG
ncbi:MAG: site-specific integrase [Fluviicoccus sp.]|uniref:tyrosine-type recombinase/integrase n=1 Tax=Fluviicoccus sp. TaxID=2003552 RepID=UPI00271667AB|nr:site-specific integrase [Fluviicoccus sp.]MDO8329025.1 site-specific integrase [Fluviicoccus sp.]